MRVSNLVNESKKSGSQGDSNMSVSSAGFNQMSMSGQRQIEHYFDSLIVATFEFQCFVTKEVPERSASILRVVNLINPEFCKRAGKVEFIVEFNILSCKHSSFDVNVMACY